MANLKDTIVLGNLTVTGKVVASDILVSGTSNEFDTIYAKKIIGQGDSTYTLEIDANSENSCMKINSSMVELTGGMRVANIYPVAGSGNFVDINTSNGSALRVGGSDSSNVVLSMPDSSAGIQLKLNSLNLDSYGHCFINCSSPGGGSIWLKPYTGTASGTGNVYLQDSKSGFFTKTVTCSSGNGSTIFTLKEGEAALVLWTAVYLGSSGTSTGVSFLSSAPVGNKMYNYGWQVGGGSKSWVFQEQGHAPNGGTVSLMLGTAGNVYCYSYGPSYTVTCMVFYVSGVGR